MTPSTAPAPFGASAATAAARAHVVAIAAAELGVTEVGGNNRGPRVEEYIAAGHGRPGDPWCAGFVTWCGLAMGEHTRRTWPLPRTMGCVALSEAALARGLRYKHPAEGAVFLLWFPRLARFAHTGFIEQVNPDGTCATIEGNTNDGGSREGWGVFRRRRHFSANDRFIWWWV